MPTAQILEEFLKHEVVEGELFERLPEGRVRCFACGHRCLIPPGRDGVCRIRFNRDGTLYVPRGYVGALQCDPIEKKPFFHALPGTNALSFGMLGCDLHCSYCVPPSTRIATRRGMLPIGAIVSAKQPMDVYTHTGQRRQVTTFFERPYRGRLLKVKTVSLPPIECTPEHPLFVRLRPDKYPGSRAEFLEAGRLTADHCLMIPKRYEFSERVVLDVRSLLEPALSPYRIRRTIPAEVLERIVALTSLGASSREIGIQVGKSASHVRHLQRHLRIGTRDFKDVVLRKAVVIKNAGRVRISKGHAPGIPAELLLDEPLAELLGFYCAGGSVTTSKKRVHSASIGFSFGKRERDKVARVKSLLEALFGVRACVVERETALAVSTGKTSLALLFKALCGGRGTEKHVPEALFKAKESVVRSFLSAYVAGDGYRAPGGQIRISTVSEELAWGVAWLVQKLGYLPRFYQYQQPTQRMLPGRSIRQAPWVYLVRWDETSKLPRQVWEDHEYRYFLIRRITSRDYKGMVYNLETEGDHTYLANFVTVHNCQNWLTSQTLRDPNAGAPPMAVTPEQLVAMAQEHGAPVVASTYNEPLITSEWAVEVFKVARARGLKTAYISNGNGTEEVLQYIRPWVDLYKVDLKGFDDRRYRELGGQLEAVKWTIRRLYELKFWLEIVTLVVPGFNDSDQELTQIAEFLVGISPNIPWHVTAFHQDYKMRDRDNTTAQTLIRAARIGERAGLHYVYAGNLPGRVDKYEHTYCPQCKRILIERVGYEILENALQDGYCPTCRTTIPGVWK